VAPVRGTLSASLAALAVEALSADRRRPAIRRDELDSLRIIVAFAGRGEPVADPRLVDPAREGLIVGGADVAVAFLPGEARTIAWALRESRRVGALRAQQPVTYQRFPVVVLSELEPPRRPTSGVSDVGP
jgi:AMMECR1 domain-containing protein